MSESADRLEIASDGSHVVIGYRFDCLTWERERERERERETIGIASNLMLHRFEELEYRSQKS